MHGLRNLFQHVAEEIARQRAAASGVNLGTPDKQIGVVRVKKVAPKYAIAEVVSGESAKRNDIVRSQEKGENP